MGTSIALVLVLAALVALAVTAAAETALERASDARLQALASRGDERARRLFGTREEPRAFLAPLTTARALFAGLAAVGVAFAGWNLAGGAGGLLVSGVIAVLVIIAVQLTVGTVAARRPEATALTLSRPAHVVSLIFYVPSVVLGAPGRLLTRKGSERLVEQEEDILAVIEREQAQGGVEEEEQRMIRGVIKLEDTTAHEIMVPRPDIAAVDIEDGIDAVIPVVIERGFSRIPVYEDSIDNIIGIVFAKDVLRVLHNGSGPRSLRDLLREATFVPESKRLDELLREMQTRRSHLAIVVDEYGGTAGLVSIEDLLEEIVGEIEDEYDPNVSPLERISDDEVILNAGQPASILEELFGYKAEGDDFDTVGGFLIYLLGRLPAEHDKVRAGSLELEVLTMEGRRIKRLKVTRLDEGEEGVVDPAQAVEA